MMDKTAYCFDPETGEYTGRAAAGQARWNRGDISCPPTPPLLNRHGLKLARPPSGRVRTGW